ncbi:glycoside hydrolase family 32 protein [Spiroplasma cantharicola]|uniref:beta-fructofuranosidase n=1 Tax=Spiroplasma cantharicola TaxID=362837 RepID=A0A0M4K1J8_9MOLU|nr:glycoside hydrolase family 32 protein [Spiroplasma cantharicola]ALD66487.1 sucrose-6-phosphate hydrolase [Spiroplasma cantharicola]
MKWEKYSLINENHLNLFQKYHNKKIKNWYNNQFHLAGFSGSTNDPNGLVFYKDQYFIFMQNCPFSIQHYNKSWALYTTKDFINYVYEGLTLIPSTDYDKNGVFSGSARVNKNGEMEIYYTGNVKFNDLERTSYTLKALIDLKEKVVSKELLFECDLKKYTGHFRDPVVFEKDNKLFMLNGAQTLENKGVLNVYEFQDEEWKWSKDILIDENDEQNSYMVECPNYFNIENKEYIFACLEQETSLAEGSHFVKYREVKVDNKANFKFKSKLKKIDLGFDFYAPQIFSNTENRIIMLGWLGNSKSNPFPKELKTWSNHLTVPRQLTLKNDLLYQMPVKELEKLRLNKIDLKNNIFNYQNGIVEIISQKVANENFEIIIKSKKKNIIIKNENNIFSIDRSLMDYNDELNLPSKINFDNLKIDSIRILIDRSCLEIFINEGEHAISLRFFIKNHNQIETNLKNLKVFQLDSNKYVWNNIIFKNELKEK